jgi:hypothetical protein
MLMLVIFTTICTGDTYKYENSVIDNILAGCTKSGATDSFCKCQIIVLLNNVPQKELAKLNESLYKIYFNSNSSIPQKHTEWIQEMNRCQGIE